MLEKINESYQPNDEEYWDIFQRSNHKQDWCKAQPKEIYIIDHITIQIVIFKKFWHLKEKEKFHTDFGV